jgi:hypothetical protein
MSLVLYAIAEAAEATIEGDGLLGQPLRGIVEGPLVAIVSDYEGDRRKPTLENVFEYEQLLEQLMSRCTIVPARFGTVLEDEAAARELLRERREPMTAALERVSGAVELGIRVGWRQSEDILPDKPPENGTEYLRGRAELDQRAQDIAHRLDALASVARTSRRRILPRPSLPVLGAYLVERERVQEFAALVEQLDDGLEQVELVCTGPWPPYSFCEATPQ